MSRSWTHKVVKQARGGQGEWFSFRTAATFSDKQSAVDYCESFATEQRQSGVVGTRILVIARKGNRIEHISKW